MKLLARLKGRNIDLFIKNREYDTIKAKKELGWEPAVLLETGVKEMAGAYLTKL